MSTTKIIALKAVVLSFGLLVGSNVFASPRDFLLIGAAKGGDIYSIKKGSGHTVVKGDKSLYGAIIRQDTEADGTIRYYKEYVSPADCEFGYGVVYIYNLSDALTNKLEWVSGGGNVVSSIAEFFLFSS